MSFPLIDVPPIEIVRDESGKALDARGLLPLELFIGKYFKHHRRFKRGPLRGQKCPTPHFLREIHYLYDNPETYDRVIWVCPRFYGKSITNFFSVIYDAVATKRYGEQVLISSTGRLAEKWLRAIKKELTENKELIRDYGNLCSEGTRYGKWTDDELYLLNGERIFANGVGTAIRGEHPGIVRLDDAENDESAKSMEQIEKLEEWVRGTIMGMLEAGCVIHWTGTFLERDTALMKAFEGKGWDESWFRIKHEAIWTKEAEENHPKVSRWHPYKVGESIWPERRPLEWLAKQESAMGTRKFAAEMMNDPRAKDRPIFQRRWFKYYNPKEDLPKNRRVTISLDLAAKDKEINDEYAMIAFCTDGGPHPRGSIWVLRVWHGHLDEYSVARMALDWCIELRAEYVVIEDVAFQIYFAGIIQRLAAEVSTYMKVKPVKPKGDKSARAKAISFLIERGDVYVIEGAHEELIEQVVNFKVKKTKDDMTDAFTQGLGDLGHVWEDAQYEEKKTREAERNEDVVAPNPFPELGDFMTAPTGVNQYG